MKYTVDQIAHVLSQLRQQGTSWNNLEMGAGDLEIDAANMIEDLANELTSVEADLNARIKTDRIKRAYSNAAMTDLMFREDGF